MSMPPANPYSNSAASSDEPVYLGGRQRSLKIRRIDPLSLGCMQGALFALIGLIPVLFIIFMTIVGAAGGGFRAAGNQLVVGVAGTLILGVLAPLVYGVMGFVGGVVLALAYNFIASFSGGVELELGE
ncbi:hypothetical protein [Allorhodopirellula solitaria]|uniref:DUF3566 domain-containing protein n=1 Tax=Allorhodopirellula solitaria TaxID=2527987 RepID=A0A5C5XU91_9BACT|nr:hypothetical protein [Allorhodopirellula solitaria]TWT66454.1 hypothetical protein CA85_25490 [Allorhodopirellula solitaria]